jgi:fluoroacetyl-CoA thioesterase
MKIGDRLEVHFTVQPSDSAQALELTPDDSYPNVFATSRLVAFMEMAATRLMKPLLEPGQHSVGVEVSIKHTAATPVGGHVRAVATYLRPEGKLYRFKVEAFDDAGPIGDGEHTRAIVSTSRLLQARGLAAGERRRIECDPQAARPRIANVRLRERLLALLSGAGYCSALRV